MKSFTSDNNTVHYAKLKETVILRGKKSSKSVNKCKYPITKHLYILTVRGLFEGDKYYT